MRRPQVLPITMYARPGCEDSDMARAWLRGHGIPFDEVDIDQDQAADSLVRRLNDGMRSTPTILVGDESDVVVEPSETQLDQAVRRAGYQS